METECSVWSIQGRVRDGGLSHETGGSLRQVDGIRDVRGQRLRRDGRTGDGRVQRGYCLLHLMRKADPSWPISKGAS